MTEKRSGFSSRIGFVLAAAGSAVGLGNIWRFPYLAAKYGGGIFLFVYLILVVTFGFALMATEIAIGRSTRLSCVEAYGKLNSKFRFLGPLTAMIPILIVPYYCVIGGWVVKYMAEFLMGNGGALAGDAYFGNFISVAASGFLNNPMPWFVGYVLLNAVILLLGVNKGIENISKLMMPLLVILAVVISIYSLALPGAMEGLKFYLLPDFSKLSLSTVLGAMGQMFYSMSLAMGIMITYGSYMKDEDNLEDSITQIQIFDTGIAMLAGLMIIPSVVAFNGGSAEGISAGPGLMFGVLPKVFATIGGGNLLGTAFFVLVFFAALTSSISLLETFVSIIQDRFHTTRKATIIGATVFTILVGSLSCLGYGPLSGITVLGMAFLDFFDFFTNSILMPIAALLTCVLVGYVVGPKFVTDEITKHGHPFTREKLYNVMIRYIAPVLLAVILLGEIAKFFGFISI
ncbi:MAG: sodium-dependent transporter [Oscillospiraceae bacterium]|nr:sodium-dependent transporter [Oscillospiraceae bacterium]